MAATTMTDTIVDFLRKNNDEAITSAVLADRFFRMKQPDPRLADRMIAGVLKDEHRCFQDDAGLWHAREDRVIRAEDMPLTDCPLCAVYCLCPPADSRRVYHLSLWRVFPAPEALYHRWLENPASLPPQEQHLVCSPADEPFAPDARAAHVAAAAEILAPHIPVFVNWHQQASCRQLFSQYGIAVPDDSFLLGRLLAAADFSPPRPLSLQGAYHAAIGSDPPSAYAYKSGESLAECAARCIDTCMKNGIRTRGEFDRRQQRDVSVSFTNKKFSWADLDSLPEVPGVYGFTDAGGTYLYIGKATNLRRRMTGYFGPTDESPKKLDTLRNDSHAFIIHECGSELESLIYEYRLIHKHHPLLNTQRSINERKGAFQPLEDMIVLLPHAREGKGLSVWLRKEKKIVCKAFSVKSPLSDSFIKQLDDFFYRETVAVSPDDFPELEIATRWVSSHRDGLVIVYPGEYADAAGIAAAIQNYWPEVAAAR